LKKYIASLLRQAERVGKILVFVSKGVINKVIKKKEESKRHTHSIYRHNNSDLGSTQLDQLAKVLEIDGKSYVKTREAFYSVNAGI